MEESLKVMLGERVAVRKFQGYEFWFVAADDLGSTRTTFDSAILTDVTFVPNARVMPDIVCGSDRLSEAEAIGTIHEWDRRLIPAEEKIERRCFVAYDPKLKRFHVKDDTSDILTGASVMLLNENGQAEAIWLKAAETPQKEPIEVVV
ncbi:hypothetical protein H7X65_01360 [Candidatus Parcubacteria bacterium]|nr:hypothetical protein [Candidatus Parcubacteria bacterium]